VNTQANELTEEQVSRLFGMLLAELHKLSLTNARTAVAAAGIVGETTLLLSVTTPASSLSLAELRDMFAELMTPESRHPIQALKYPIHAAASEVLRVISSSPGDLQPVFDTILERATRLCEATHGQVWRYDGEQLHAVAVRGDARFVQWLRQHSPVRPFPGSSAYRIVRGERFVHVADRREEGAYRDNLMFRELVDTSGIRASLSVALRKDETLLGMINVYRQEVRPFTDKEIALVQNFAAQG
jgi:transcriptional regulator with GAF, ATPase, and Fis domain